jgi:hypothetical protein
MVVSILRSTISTVSAPATTHYGAQSHAPRKRCVRFAAGVAVGSRNTRFQAVCWAFPWSDFHRASVGDKARVIASRPVSPARMEGGACGAAVTFAARAWRRGR